VSAFNNVDYPLKRSRDTLLKIAALQRHRETGFQAVFPESYEIQHIQFLGRTNRALSSFVNLITGVAIKFLRYSFYGVISHKSNLLLGQATINNKILRICLIIQHEEDAVGRKNPENNAVIFEEAVGMTF